MKKLLVIVLAVALGLSFGMTQASAQEPAAPVLPVSDIIGTQVAPGGIGDVLLFSMYDVREQDEPGETLIPIRGAAWENYIAIENTSGLWTAFHLRFRSWKKSIEVFDHVILLSPYDVFWMTLTRASDSGLTTEFVDGGGFEAFNEGDVIMKSSDLHTLYNSGLIYENEKETYKLAQGWTSDEQLKWIGKFQPYLLSDCGYPEGGKGVPGDINLEMQAGHIEVIGLWQLKPVACLDSGAWEKGNCEDTHDIKNLVLDIYADGTSTPTSPTINVYDILDGLFFEWNNSTFVDEDWPRHGKVKLHNSCNDGVLPDGTCASYYIRELPDPKAESAQERWGWDCNNVLTGMLSMGDPLTGRYQLENFIALENFRTNIWDGYGESGYYGEYYYTALDTERSFMGKSMPLWQHRDGYWGGGIFFPTSIMRWWYGYGNPAKKFTGGSYHTYLWAYTNENWTISVGPSLRDGDDFWGLNWNDVNLFTEDLVENYGSTSDFFEDDAQVHYFNDIWSLDDVEAALAKSEIWYTHYRTRPESESQANINTYVVMTYPTKHYHWFFADWPFMYQEGTADFPVSADDVDEYWANLWDYRGDKAVGEKDVEESKNKDGDTIADWFYDQWKNGLLAVSSRVWDMEQNTPTSGPGTPPPGSPFRPNIEEKFFVPHETNLINVGEAEDTSGIGLGDANYLLAAATDEGPFNVGHFLLSTSILVNGERALGFGGPIHGDIGAAGLEIDYARHGIYYNENASWSAGSYPLPPIGLVSYLHAYTGQGLITRSNMAEWHYRPELLPIIPKVLFYGIHGAFNGN